MLRFRTLMAAACVTIVAVSCAPQTTMLSSWSAPNYQMGSIKKLVVLGVAKSPGVRRTYEDKFVKALQSMKIDAEPSYTIIPDVVPGDSIGLQQLFAQHGYTHVICTRLVDQKTVETYIPPTVSTVGYSPYYPSYYGSWGSYYSVGYAYAVDPGYVEHSLVVSLETNLYDVDTPGLIWSGVTETWVDGAPTANIDAVIGTTIQELKKKKIL